MISSNSAQKNREVWVFDGWRVANTETGHRNQQLCSFYGLPPPDCTGSVFQAQLELFCRRPNPERLTTHMHTHVHPAHMHAPKLPPPNEHVVLLLSKHVITARCQPSCRPASTFSLFFSLPAALLYDHIIDGGETPRGRSYRLTFLMVFSAYCKGAVYGSAV